MKKGILVFLALLLALPVLCFGQVNVRGYWRDTDRDGVKDTYVEPHQRTRPNPSRMDNYSYPGNYNPNRGSFTPYSTSPRETYPSNPNPYERGRYRGYGY